MQAPFAHCRCLSKCPSKVYGTVLGCDTETHSSTVQQVPVWQREAQEGQGIQQQGMRVGVSGNIFWSLSKLCPKDQGGVSLTRMWEGISGEGATHRGMRQQEQAIILVSPTLLGRSVSHPEQGFSKTKVCPDHLWDLLKCRLRFSSSGVHSEILPFSWAPKGCQCYWPADHTWRPRALVFWSSEHSCLLLTVFEPLLDPMTIMKPQPCREEGTCPRSHSLKWHPWFYSLGFLTSDTVLF